MAATDCTITQPVRTRDHAGIRKRVVIGITGPSSYTTGGFPLTPGQMFLGQVESFPNGAVALSSGATPRLLVFDSVNNKGMVFVPNTAAEVANTTDLSAYTWTVEVAGK